MFTVERQHVIKFDCGFISCVCNIYTIIKHIYASHVTQIEIACRRSLDSTSFMFLFSRKYGEKKNAAQHRFDCFCCSYSVALLTRPNEFRKQYDHTVFAAEQPDEYSHRYCCAKLISRQIANLHALRRIAQRCGVHIGGTAGGRRI